jgi:hypothetical protein
MTRSRPEQFFDLRRPRLESTGEGERGPAAFEHHWKNEIRIISLVVFKNCKGVDQCFSTWVPPNISNKNEKG